MLVDSVIWESEILLVYMGRHNVQWAISKPANVFLSIPAKEYGDHQQKYGVFARNGEQGTHDNNMYEYSLILEGGSPNKSLNF